MAFQLSLTDFNTLALKALQHPEDINFGKSTVATRLREVFKNRQLGRPSKSDSLELRKNLADEITRIYTVDNALRIPESVLKALNVDKFASGFEIRDGALVATNHPLTDRRLVAIMTAIKLEKDGLGNACQGLSNRVAALRNGNHTPDVNAFTESAATAIETLTRTIKSAAEQKVKPATLKLFMSSLENEINLVKNLYTELEPYLPEAERPELRGLVNQAVILGESFGAEVTRLPGPPARDNHVLVNVDDVLMLDAVLPDVEVPRTDPEAIFTEHKANVRAAIRERTGTALDGLGLDLAQLITYSEADAETLRTDGDAATNLVNEKAQAIAEGVSRVCAANLDQARKVELLRTVIAANGTVDEARLAAAVKSYRTETYQRIADEAKSALEKNVADIVRAQLANDPDCAPGLENLTKDFPKMNNFAKRVKADHKGGALATFDLRAPGTLEAKLAGRLEATKAVLAGQVDAEKDELAFRQQLADVTRTAAEAIAARLKEALVAPVFEDDRTILADLATDPAKAQEFDAALAAARQTYNDKVIVRIDQSLMAGRVAAAQQKPPAKDAEYTTSRTFRTIYDVRVGTNPYDKVQRLKVRKPAKDAEDRLTKGANAGTTLKASIRSLCADLFTEKAKAPEGMRAILLANADALQAMMLDPVLIESTAVPGDDRTGGDAVRKLLGSFLAAIGPSVNNGQLAAADFRAALKTALAEGKHVDDFTKALQAAGREILSAMQQQLTQKLTNVLRTLAGGGEKLEINQKTLAELGASGLGSMDEGYGKFLANVLDNYFTDEALASDRNRMLESFFRNGKEAGTIGDALSALIKGAGPIFQKVLQSIPLEGLPEEVVKALVDVKSGLAPIPRETLQQRVNAYVADYNREHPDGKIKSCSLGKSLGAASVGQAVLCTFTFEAGEKSTVVVKFLRPDIEAIATRERAFFDKWATAVSPEMGKTFAARMDGIMEELDFSNEARYIEAGQCYGQAQNYGSAACLDENTTLKFKSMNVAKRFQPTGGKKPLKDMLVLDVAKGQPLDRINREMRSTLDGITTRLTKSVSDGKGGTLKVYRADTGFELMATRRQLEEMYEAAENRRIMLEELIRRFSSELIARNFGDKSGGGGFMHGDLHGGNLLVSNGSMTVIDFGNSFQFDGIDRQGLVAFIAACGFSNADLVLSTITELHQKRHEQQVKSGLLPQNSPAPRSLSKRSDFKELKAGIQEIVAKGDANDVVARGMAVVQYLQRMKVEVPGPIVNFTETVMRLSAAHAETTAILNDIGDTIESLQLDPNANTSLDFFAAQGENLFKGNLDRKAKRRIVENSAAAIHLNEHFEALKNYARNPVDPSEYHRLVSPIVALFGNLSFKLNNDPNFMTVGEMVTLIAKELKALGDGRFEPGDDRVTRLLIELSSFCRQAVDFLGMQYQETKSAWAPSFGESINDCLSVGITQLGRKKLISIFGTASVSMGTHMNSVLGKAEQTIRQREMSSIARKRYRQRTGNMPPETRRYVDRLVDEHFIWSDGKPEEIFSRKNWFEDKDAAEAVKKVLQLNLGKLNDTLKSANLAGGEAIENFALIPFAFRHGLPQALAKLTDEQFNAFCLSVNNEAISQKLAFLRRDPAVIEAIQIGRAFDAADALEIPFATVQKCYSKTLRHFPSLEKPISFANESLPTLVKNLAGRYAALLTWASAGTKFSSSQKEALVNCGFMRYLLDEGFLQKLKDLSADEQNRVLSAFANKANLTGQKDKLPNLKPIFTRLLGYMK